MHKLSVLTILHANAAGDWESNLRSFSHFLGVEARLIRCPDAGEGPSEWLSLVGDSSAVAMSADCLAALEDRNLVHLLVQSGGSALKVFLIFGYRQTERHSALAKRWSNGAVRRVTERSGADRYSFPRASVAQTRQLAGCEFEREPRGADCSFDLEAGVGGESIMELAGRPAFVRSASSGIWWFHWAGGESMDSPKTKVREETVPQRSDRFVPAIIFLRAAFPGACWENPCKTARIIIDDPLLTRSYGFLNYDQLFKSLVSLRYGLTTAFIPSNYLRTSRKAARAFAEHYPAHAICVHGCDHTNNEFGMTNESLLIQKSLEAIARVEKHRERTGIPCDRVMVFPQGKFSNAAMRALRRAGFLAVVASTRQATDGSDECVPLGEELLPATNRYSGVPIFTRRYPKQLSTYALDLFLGKPAHVVEHHNWFAMGFGEMERCVRFLQVAEPALSWPTLSDSLPRQHLRREGRDGKCHVRFFTPVFHFENEDHRSRSFVFTRAEPEVGAVKKVTLDGREVPFVHRDGFLEFAAELAQHQVVCLAVVDATEAAPEVWAPGLKYRVLVRLRRALSELRDNHLVKHPALLRTAKRMVRRLKWSADSRGRAGGSPRDAQ